VPQVIPPPPFLTTNSSGKIDFQPLNRWLLEVQSILSSEGTTFVDGTTAVTQPPGDNSTLIATDAFVLANSASAPSTTVPLVDATPGEVGVLNTFARGDHVHPTDTSRAGLASPAFTGTPTAPTAAALTDDTQIATTAYADLAVGVETTRAEAAEALLAPKASPAFTGTPTAPTQSPGDDSTKIATTAYVDNTFAPLASPGLTGVPTAPTAANGTNTTQLATTQFVQSAVAGGGGSAPVVKAAVFFTQTGGVYTIVKQFNVSSITNSGTGLFTVNFTSALADALYYATGSVDTRGVSSGWVEIETGSGGSGKTTTACPFASFNNASALTNPPGGYILFFE
jgi:hypothetical protein